MLLNKIRRGLAALGLAALSLTPAAPAFARSNGPALWEVKDKDTTVYLFGTIHLLPKNSQWRTPKFEKAVQGSQSLVVETIIDTGNPQKIAGIMSALGYSSGLPPIASRVPADKRAPARSGDRQDPDPACSVRPHGDLDGVFHVARRAIPDAWRRG